MTEHATPSANGVGSRPSAGSHPGAEALAPARTLGPPRVLLVQHSNDADHFPGVVEALASLGVHAQRVNQHAANRLATMLRAEPRGTRPQRVVVVKDTQGSLSLYALRAAREAGAATALLMDGILEFRNTFQNPWAEPDFLRPAPADVVLAAGPDDAERLKSWGNQAVATGLPRLDACATAPRVSTTALGSTGPTRAGRVMIATAKRPAFSDAEYELLVRVLGTLRDTLTARLGAEGLCWRLTDGLSERLGVQNDPRPLGECLNNCAGVLTSPSTLIVEAMLAGLPVGVIFPWEYAELWPGARWVWSGAGPRASEDLELIVSQVLAASPDAEHRRILDRLHAGAPGANAAENVARALRGVLEGEISTRRARGLPIPSHALSTARLPAHRPRSVSTGAGASRSARRIRVVNMVNVDGSPVGGVMTWALRLARSLPARRPQFDVRTLAVVNFADALHARGFDIDDGPGGTTDLCVLDDLMDTHERLEHLRQSLLRLDPDIILPNFADQCYMGAILARAELEKSHPTRIVSIAHTDSAYYQDLASTYDTFDACVGVSGACMNWVRPLAAGRPCREIPYGIPISPRPREASLDASRPLRIAYIGRMVEEQKRVSRLWEVIEGLDALLTGDQTFEFHLVGDGPDMDKVLARAGGLRLRHGRLEIHGRRAVDWVERFTRGIDVSVLVSSYEGTSVTMLEAMGQGVLPCVTNVGSGVEQFVRDGESGIVVGLEEMDLMSRRLAELVRDRSLLRRLSLGAYHAVAHPGSPVTPDAHADAYADLFEQVLALPAFTGGHAASALRPIDTWRWKKYWCDRPAQARDWCAQQLGALGYAPVEIDPPEARLAALVRRPRSTQEPTPGVVLTEVATAFIEPSTFTGLREAGIGVAVAPRLAQDELIWRVGRVIRDALRSGSRRIAVYGTGQHTHRLRVLFEYQHENLLLDKGEPDPFVAFIDDAAPPLNGRSVDRAERRFDRPMLTLADAVERLSPDTILLSSDAFESVMWARTADLRARGVRVIALYGSDAAPSPDAPRAGAHAAPALAR